MVNIMTRQSSREAADEPLRRARQVDRALSQLREIVLRGLEHGFFECSVSGEIIQERKRRLLIKAGHSFLFVIAADELGLDDRS
jgi:hypothetical protein